MTTYTELTTINTVFEHRQRTLHVEGNATLTQWFTHNRRATGCARSRVSRVTTEKRTFI